MDAETFTIDEDFVRCFCALLNRLAVPRIRTGQTIDLASPSRSLPGVAAALGKAVRCAAAGFVREDRGIGSERAVRPVVGNLELAQRALDEACEEENLLARRQRLSLNVGIYRLSETCWLPGEVVELDLTTRSTIYLTSR